MAEKRENTLDTETPLETSFIRGILSVLGESALFTVASLRTLLTDVEESGNFTPTVTYSGGNGTLSYNNQEGSWVRKGSTVFVYGYVGFTKGTASGNLALSSLPKTVKQQSVGVLVPPAVVTPIRIGAAGKVVGCDLVKNTTDAALKMISQDTTTTKVDVTDAECGTSPAFNFSMTYEIED